ncbi:MAG TPA: hypothetical protein VIG06_22895 [Kofleriaceae bacterium]
MRRTAILVGFAALAGCRGGGGGGDGVGSTGTDVGNPVVVDLQFAAYDLAIEDTAVDEATIEIERIRLRPADDCEGGAEIELEGPFHLDLLDPRGADELAGLPLDARAWCRIEMAWHRDDATDTAIRVAGSAGGDPFEIRSRRNDELRIESLDEDGFTVDEATSALFVAFDMATWLDGVDLVGADREPDGAIAVSEDSNRDLLERFEENVESATRLFGDGDGDGALGDDEHDDADALGAGTR